MRPWRSITGRKITGDKMKIICKHCGKEGSAAPNKIKKGYGKFCSRKCATDWRSLHFSSDMICAVCGKKYRVVRARVDAGWGKFCSLKCHGESQEGSKHRFWNGGRKKSNGYIFLYRPDHPRASKNYVAEHVLVAEKVLGHYLPDAAVVHHVNGNKADNRSCNLVICQDNAYHHFIHAQQRKIERRG